MAEIGSNGVGRKIVSRWPRLMSVGNGPSMWRRKLPWESSVVQSRGRKYQMSIELNDQVFSGDSTKRRTRGGRRDDCRLPRGGIRSGKDRRDRGLRVGAPVGVIGQSFEQELFDVDFARIGAGAGWVFFTGGCRPASFDGVGQQFGPLTGAGMPNKSKG